MKLNLALCYVAICVASNSEAAVYEVDTFIGGAQAVDIRNFDTPASATFGNGVASATVSFSPTPIISSQSKAIGPGRTIVNNIAVDTETSSLVTMSYRFDVFGGANTIALVKFDGLFGLSTDPHSNVLNQLQLPGSLLITPNQSTASIDVYGAGLINSSGASWSLFSQPFAAAGSSFEFSNRSTGNGLISFTSTLGGFTGGLLPYTANVQGGFTGSIAIQLDAFGFGRGGVQLSSNSRMRSATFVDPYIYLAPSYIALHPGASIVTEIGVGNIPAVPESSTVLLLAAGVTLIVLTRARRLSKTYL